MLQETHKPNLKEIAKWQSYSFEVRGGRRGGGGEGGGGNISRLMQILNLNATRESQTKFEGNRIKNGKVTVLRLVEEEEGEEEEEEEEEEEKIYQH